MSDQKPFSESFNEFRSLMEELIFNQELPCIFYPQEDVIPPIEKIIFNPPATIVFWDDHEKTVVKCKESEEFDYECGLAFAIAKRYFGSRSEFKRAIGRAKKITSDSDSDIKNTNRDTYSSKQKNISDALAKINTDMTNHKQNGYSDITDLEIFFNGR